MKIVVTCNYRSYAPGVTLPDGTWLDEGESKSVEIDDDDFPQWDSTDGLNCVPEENQ